MSSSRFRNVNRNDAVSAYQIFIETTGRQYGHNFKAQTETYDDAPSFEVALRREPKHIVVIEAWQYLTMNLGAEYRPFFVVAERGKVGRRYLILTQRDSRFRNLADLRGQKLIEMKHSSTSAGKVWLDTLLLASSLGAQEAFFDSVELVDKPTAVVLPVFFGKAPACLVDEVCFDVMTELNPQVGKNLRAMAVSDVFADVVLCINKNGWRSEKERTDTIRSLQDLHLQPTGQQILALFKIDKLIPFQEDQLDTVRWLRVQRAALRERNGNALENPMANTAKGHSQL